MLLTQADRALFNPDEPLAKDLVILQTVPALCKQESALEKRNSDNSDSDIAMARIGRDAVEKKLFLQRILHQIRAFIDREFRVGVRKTWNEFIMGAKKQDVLFKND